MSVGDMCKCAAGNTYEPLYPVVELITLSKDTDTTFHSWLIGSNKPLICRNSSSSHLEVENNPIVFKY